MHFFVLKYLGICLKLFIFAWFCLVLVLLCILKFSLSQALVSAKLIIPKCNAAVSLLLANGAVFIKGKRPQVLVHLLCITGG